jgi:hypothetical protein
LFSIVIKSNRTDISTEYDRLFHPLIPIKIRLIYGNMNPTHSLAQSAEPRLGSGSGSGGVKRQNSDARATSSPTRSTSARRGSRTPSLLVTGSASGSGSGPDSKGTLGQGSGLGSGFSAVRAIGCGCSACGGTGSNHAYFTRDYQGSKDKGTYPPWRSGMW